MFSQVKRILEAHPKDENRTENERQAICDAILTIPFFHNMFSDNPSQQNMFLRESQKYFKLETFDKDEVIFYAGDKGDKLYIILEGVVGIYKPIVSQRPDSPSKLRKSILFMQPFLAQRKSQFSLSPRQSRFSILTNVNMDRSPMSVKSSQEEQNFNEKIIDLGPGKCFGELAITKKKPRFATAKVWDEGSVYVASLDKTSYEEIFVNNNNEVDKKLQIIQNVFKSVPINTLIRISYNFQKVFFSHNQIIYKQNKPATHCYIIGEGEIVIEEQQKQTSKKQNKLLRPKPQQQLYHQLAVLGKDQIFGLEDLDDDLPRSNQARCISQNVIHSNFLINRLGYSVCARCQELFSIYTNGCYPGYHI